MYTMQEVGKVKIELQQVTTKLDGERTVQKDLREKLSEVDNKLSGIAIRLYLKKMFGIKCMKGPLSLFS